MEGFRNRLVLRNDGMLHDDPKSFDFVKYQVILGFLDTWDGEVRFKTGVWNDFDDRRFPRSKERVIPALEQASNHYWWDAYVIGDTLYISGASGGDMW